MEKYFENELLKRLQNQLILTEKESKQILFNLQEIDKIRLWAGLKFIDKEYNVLLEIFFLESLIAIDQPEKCKKLTNLFCNFTNFEEKVNLIDRFLFSEPFNLGQKKGIHRHVQFSDFVKDEEWIKEKIDSSWINWKEYCSSGNTPLCFCMEWLKSHKDKGRINCYLEKIIEYLYDMRCAVVHEAFPVNFLAVNEKTSLVDSYPSRKHKKRFVSYNVYMSPDSFFKITRNVAKRYLLNTSK